MVELDTLTATFLLNNGNVNRVTSFIGYGGKFDRLLSAKPSAILNCKAENRLENSIFYHISIKIIYVCKNTCKCKSVWRRTRKTHTHIYTHTHTHMETREEIRWNRDVHVNARTRVHASRRNNKLYRIEDRVYRETFLFVPVDGDRQVQADSDMSVELLLVLLYISIMAGVAWHGPVGEHECSVRARRTAKVDRARWTHPYLDTHGPNDEIISR